MGAAADMAYGGLGPLALGVTWALCAIGTILLTLRVYVYFGLKRRVGTMQLVWVAVAWVTGFTAQITLTISIRAYGIGNHLAILLQAGTVANAVLWVWICQFFALASIASGKCAAAASILAIQGPTGMLSRIALWSLAAINVLADAAIMIGIWFQCNPVAKLWNTTLPGNCNGKQPVTKLALAVGSINSASDFIFAIYPVYMLWRTQISQARKIGASALLGCVAFAGVCAAVKSSKLYNIEATSDPTYEIMHLILWAFTEQWVVNIVVIIPTLGPLISIAIQRVSSSYNSRNYKSETPGSHSHELQKYRPDVGNNKRPHTFIRSEGFNKMPPSGDLATNDSPESYIFMQRDMTVEQHSAKMGDEEALIEANKHKLGL